MRKFLRRPELWLGVVLATFGAFVAEQALRVSRPAPPPAAATADRADDTGEGLSRLQRSALPPPPPHDYAATGRLLGEAKGTTYMDEILQERGGNVARWVDRRDDPIRVWIQPRPVIRDFWPEFRDRARDAFYTWAAAGVPLRFLFVDDSSAAEVRVRWVDRFNDSAAGKTYWARDQNWWIVDADIELAVHRPTGEAYDSQAIRAIALHEVGHLIGLDHCTDTANIMAPRVHVTSLSAEDLRTASLVYKLLPGPVAPPAR